jgi:hypothetical protein
MSGTLAGASGETVVDITFSVVNVRLCAGIRGFGYIGIKDANGRHKAGHDEII